MDNAAAVLAFICVGLVSGAVGFVLGQFLESRGRDQRGPKLR